MTNSAGDGAEGRLALIDSVYACAVDPERWAAFLDQITRTFSGFSTIYRWPNRNPGDNSPLFDNFGEFGDLYREHFHSRNVWVTEVDRPTSARAIVPSEGLVSNDRLERTEFYGDWMRPQGLKHGVSCLLRDGHDFSYNLGIIRGPEFGAFTGEEQRLLADILPHMSRALELGQVLEAFQQRSSGMLRAFDTLGVGALLVDAGCRIHFANPLAERLLATESALRAPGGRLGLTRPALDAGLRAAIDAATGSGREAGGRTGKILSVPRTGGSPLSLNIAPLDERDRIMFGTGPLALVVVSDGSRSVDLDADALRSAFDLTLAEARLAAAIASGTTLPSYASSTGVSLSTVRTHLAAIFSKTNTNRQADLVRLLTGNPWLQKAD